MLVFYTSLPFVTGTLKQLISTIICSTAPLSLRTSYVNVPLAPHFCTSFPSLFHNNNAWWSYWGNPVLADLPLDFDNVFQYILQFFAITFLFPPTSRKTLRSWAAEC